MTDNQTVTSSFSIKAARVKDFLERKGWTVSKTNDIYFFLAPPPGMVFEREFFYKVPTHEQGIDYDRYMGYLVESIASLYRLDVEILMKKFTRNAASLSKKASVKEKELVPAL